jgi:hypothetical protein
MVESADMCDAVASCTYIDKITEPTTTPPRYAKRRQTPDVGSSQVNMCTSGCCESLVRLKHFVSRSRTIYLNAVGEVTLDICFHRQPFGQARARTYLNTLSIPQQRPEKTSLGLHHHQQSLSTRPRNQKISFTETASSPSSTVISHRSSK